MLLHETAADPAEGEVEHLGFRDVVGLVDLPERLAVEGAELVEQHAEVPHLVADAGEDDLSTINGSDTSNHTIFEPDLARTNRMSR